jgi:hypothetical protein
MKDDQNRDFFEEFLKWFFIWSIIVFLCKAFVFACKILFIAIQQMIYLICIGIAKISPILKDKFSDFSNSYATIYKPKLKKKREAIFESFSNFKANIISKFSNLEAKKIAKDNNKPLKTSKKKIRTKKAKQSKNTIKHEQSSIILQLKKARYAILEFYYKYELQIIILIVIIAIIVAIVLGVTVFKN